MRELNVDEVEQVAGGCQGGWRGEEFAVCGILDPDPGHGGGGGSGGSDTDDWPDIYHFYDPGEGGGGGGGDPPPCPHHEGNVVDGDRSVTFTQPNGATIQNDGGSLSWRNNNPGNIRSGTFADNHGALGEADGFAVFGSYSAGLLALEALITGPSYSSLSIYDAVARYAPPGRK